MFSKIPAEGHEALLKALFVKAVDGLIIIDQQGRIVAMNPASLELFGYTAEELLHQNIRQLMPSPHREQHDSYMDHYHSTGEAHIIGIGREVQGRRKDGSTFEFWLAVSKVEVQQQTFYAGIVHDVAQLRAQERKISALNAELEAKVEARTEELSQVVNRLLQTNQRLNKEIGEREKAEARLLSKEKQLLLALEKEKELNEFKSRFVSMASHQFRTPLSTMLSSANLLRHYTDTDQQDRRNKHINRIQSAIHSLTHILNDFLSLSKVEEGKIVVNATTFIWQDLIAEVIEEAEGLLKAGQHIRDHLPTEALSLHQDRWLLKNILLNLLSNATKYSPEQSVIDLSTRLASDHMVVEVRDQGMGIPLKDQEYLFTRFFRAGNVSNIDGSGLGLAIVRQYIELLGGRVQFESMPGEGACFSLIVPLAYRPGSASPD